jgi:hypothetical protein
MSDWPRRMAFLSENLRPVRNKPVPHGSFLLRTDSAFETIFFVLTDHCPSNALTMRKGVLSCADG